jgi:hypothetical protein
MFYPHRCHANLLEDEDYKTVVGSTQRGWQICSLSAMDSKAAAKAWADAAALLRDQKQLQAACQTISRLSDQPSACTAAVQAAVIKLDLPRALANAVAAVLGERKRQRDWRAEAYAERVWCVVNALIAVQKVAEQPQQQRSTAAAGGLRSSSRSTAAEGCSSRSTVNCPAAVRQTAAMPAVAISQLPASLLPRLAIALQDVAVLAEQSLFWATPTTSSSSSCGRGRSSSSSSSFKHVEGQVPALVAVPFMLLTFTNGLISKEPEQFLASPAAAALAVPAAQLAVALLRAAAAAQQTAAGDVDVDRTTHCIPMCIYTARMLAHSCSPLLV